MTANQGVNADASQLRVLRTGYTRRIIFGGKMMNLKRAITLAALILLSGCAAMGVP